MISIPLVINGVDFAPIATGINFEREITFEKTIKTMDGTEHYIGRQERTVITFSLMISREMSPDVRRLLAGVLEVETIDPDYGRETRRYICPSNVAKKLELYNHVDSANYYSVSDITLRGLEVRT